MQRDAGAAVRLADRFAVVAGRRGRSGGRLHAVRHARTGNRRCACRPAAGARADRERRAVDRPVRNRRRSGIGPQSHVARHARRNTADRARDVRRSPHEPRRAARLRHGGSAIAGTHRLVRGTRARRRTARRRPAMPRPDARLHEPARAVRPCDRVVPGGQAPLRADDGVDRVGAIGRARCCTRVGCRNRQHAAERRIARRHRHREIRRERRVCVLRTGSDPAARRRRLYMGIRPASLFQARTGIGCAVRQHAATARMDRDPCDRRRRIASRRSVRPRRRDGIAPIGRTRRACNEQRNARTAIAARSGRLGAVAPDRRLRMPEIPRRPRRRGSVARTAQGVGAGTGEGRLDRPRLADGRRRARLLGCRAGDFP